MDLIAGYSLPNGLLNMNYKTRNRAGQPVQPSTDTITNAITEGLLPMLASAGIGTGAGIAGQFGDAENLGRLAINKLGGNVNPNTTLPTQEGILSYLNSITPLKPYTDNTYTKIGANLLAPILDPTALITTAKASKPVAKAVGEHAWNKTEDMMRQQGLILDVYRPSTPLKPDPLVGTQFERQYLGGLAEKTPVKIEDLEGASVAIMPWDSSNRNYAIKSISNEELPNEVITHGGFDYPRDVEHIKKGIGGASNLSIAKRIQDRDAQARLENLAAGGSGKVIHMPVTMGEGAENFSVQPTEVVLGLIDAREPSKKFIKELNDSLKNYVIPKKTKEGYIKTQPFKNFKGVHTEEGRMQLYTGEGLDSTAGELRKALINRTAGLKKNQEYLGFNAEDLVAALTDPALMGVPKGYIGNTVLQTGEGGMHLLPSQNRTYTTDFTADYMGSLGHNVPVETILPGVFSAVSKELATKKGDLRTNVLGALEKRKKNFSQIIDKNVINNYYKYLNENN